MAPVVQALKRESWTKVCVVATAQHRELLDQLLSAFGIAPDTNLNVMTHNQTLAELTSRLIERVDAVLAREKPAVVLSQGDTTTVLGVALVCFYRDIAFGHVEAGLRTFDRYSPFPEEMNRVLAGRLARYHFCPTNKAAENLRLEGVHDDSIYITGNTIIDTLMQASQTVEFRHDAIDPKKRLLLVTAHRRESFGEPLSNICAAINRITELNPGLQVLYPVHPNPNVRDTAKRILGDNPSVILCEPMDYLDFVAAMKRAYLIVTDSGGVQEEAPALGKPVLVLRETTERPEAVVEGVARVVGTNRDAIVDAVHELLSDEGQYESMARNVLPYGDGQASQRIVSILRNCLDSNT